MALMKNEIKFSSFISDVLTLSIGTIITQIILIISAPVITRLYGPEAFGISAVFASIIGIIGVVACLRYELSIILPESDIEAANLFGACVIITFSISCLTIPIIFFYNEDIARLLNAPQLGFYLWFVPLSIFCYGIFLALNNWNSRLKNFKGVAISRLTNSVSTAGIQLGAGFIGYGNAGSLIIGKIAGQFLSSLYLTIFIFKKDFRAFWEKISAVKMYEGIKRYSRFPLIDTFSTLLNTISWQLPILLFAVFYSPAVSGFYALSIAVIQLPSSLVGSAISQAFFPHGTEAFRKNELHKIVEHLFKILLIIIAFPLLTMLIIGNDAFSIIFGNSWAEAGVFAQILCLFFLLNFIFDPLSYIYIIVEKQIFGLYFNIVNFLTRLIALVIGGLFFDSHTALAFFAIVGIATYMIALKKLMDYAKVQWEIIRKHVISVFSMFIPAGIVLIFCELFIKNPYVTLITAVICIVIFYLYILKTDNDVREFAYQFKFW